MSRSNFYRKQQNRRFKKMTVYGSFAWNLNRQLKIELKELVNMMKRRDK